MRRLTPHTSRPGPLLFKEDGTVDADLFKDATLDEGEGGDSPWLVCKACGQKVARTSWRCEVNGRHRHVFSNPGGYVFEIGCFAKGLGLIMEGDPTDEFTWFPGYRWQIALCSTCAALLGWRYTGASHFYGLVLAALAESCEDEP